ncbi:stage II sporulation protein R [bacterium 210917-SL.2.15]|nr:stage II sporulation protein R [bacterium 210917-SL.2.15]
MKQWRDTRRLGKWIAVSLLVGLAISLLWGVWALQRQQALAQEVIRLHVIAASDSDADQALKLQVRDAVLAQATDWLAGTTDRDEAENILRTHLAELRDTAQATVQSQGCGDAVEAWLTPETYPTRDYGAFALPGGEYLSLRIIIGEGAGHNWWCVVFPPLCTTAATGDMEEAAQDAGLSEEDVALITRSDEGYILKFKSIELWEQWAAGWKQ